MKYTPYTPSRTAAPRCRPRPWHVAREFLRPDLPALLAKSAQAYAPSKPVPQIFNRESALERVRGEHESLRQLADLFLSELPLVMKEISDAAFGGDLVQLALLAHRLQGATTTVSGEEMTMLAGQLEFVARNRRSDEVPRLMICLQEQADCLSQALHAYAAETVASGAPVAAGY